MTDRSERKLWSGEITHSAHQAMKEADEPMWRIADEAIKMYLGIDDVSTEAGFESRIEDLEDELSRLDEEIEQKQERRDRVLEKLEGVRAQYQEFLEKRESYNSRIDRILESLLDQPNVSIFAFKSELKEAAKQRYGRPTSENIQKVIEDAKERRDERGLGINDTRFTDHMTNGQVATADGEGEPDFDWEFDFEPEEGDDGAE